MVALVDSSVKKIKTTWWIPSRGMRVRVDLANLRWREGGEERKSAKKCRVLHKRRPTAEAEA